MKKRGTKNLTYTQRLQLEAYLESGLHKKIIAEKLGVCLATIYNELKRGAYERKKLIRTDYYGDRYYKKIIAYSPVIAEQKYRINLTSHGPELKLGNDYEFVRYVEKRVIEDKLSPCAIVGEIARNNLFSTNISKTTLYRYIGNGVFYNLEYSNLPMPRKKQKHRRTVVKKAPRGTSIEKRPEEVISRDTFGHWEMDCVLGKKSRDNVLLVFTERLTRYEIMLKMPNKNAKSVVKSLNKLERYFGQKFRKVFKSITVDNGAEFSDFEGLERSIYNGKRTKVYYCHPYSSCERGSNERLNRDIRRWIPKSSNISKYSEAHIRKITDWLNAYPREIFGFATPSEMFAKQLAAL